MSIPYDKADPKIAYALDRIKNDYGDAASVSKKQKALLKFGRAASIDTADGFVTIWNHATADQNGDETYVTTNSIDGISSSSTSDTSITATIEYHTVSGTGTDSQFTFGTQTASLNGQNKVTLSTPCARVSRVTLSATPVGDVYVYSGTPSSGVPNPVTNGHAKVNATEVRSYKAATTFSNTDYFILTQAFVGTNRTTNAVADFVLEVREAGGSFIPKFESTANQSGLWLDFNPCIIVPKNADIRLRGAAGANNSGLRGFFNGFLATTS